MGLFDQFISSAVRQVGRDGGKVISNKIYGNAHASKLMIVRDNMSFSSSNEVYSYSDQGFKEGDFIIEGTKYYNVQPWFLVFTPIYLIPVIGTIPALIFAYQTFISKHYSISTPLIWKTVQIKDGRKKEGYREMNLLTPDILNQEVKKLEIPKINKSIGYVSLFFALLPFLVAIIYNFIS